MPGEIARALEARVAELKQRGGVCTLYAGVLENAYHGGRITLRPFMWRVGGRLASGQATPNGEMTLAREIDPLNVGLRTVDDVVWSMEHEAVHIALRIASAEWPREDGADSYVRACRKPRSEADATRSTRGR